MDINVVDAIPVPAFVVSEDDMLVAANAQIKEQFQNLTIGRNFLTVFRQPGLSGLIESVRSSAPTKKDELQIRTASGDVFSATGARLGPDHVLVCLQNINETAAAIQMRRDFVADLSHELRTPLTSIRGILETSQGDPEALSHFLPIMLKETDRANRLVTDLLKLSKVQLNEKRKPSDLVHVQKVVEDACAPIAAVAEQLNVRFETDLPDTDIYMYGDSDELVSAVSNLVENAVRYGAAGGIVTVKVRLEDTGAGQDAKVVLIEVADKGVGVEAHHIPRLTERFYRVDSHRSRETGGSGLGLAIVKHVVTHHRGRLAFKSAPGQGLSVTMSLPGARLE